MSYSIRWLQSLEQVIQGTQGKLLGKEVSLSIALERIKELFFEVQKAKKSVWWVGNGGSSALCSHLSQDLLNKYGVRSQTLTDTALLTCMANDYGYEQVYSKPLETLLNGGDLLIAISSSGRSKNILNCVEVAQKKQAKVVCLSGFRPGNPLSEQEVEVSLHCSSQLYGIVEIAHEALLHSVIETLVLKKEELDQNLWTETVRLKPREELGY